jgi:hypothetical protein
MSMPISTGSLSKLLWPGVSAVFESAKKDIEDTYSKIFKTVKIDRNFIEDVNYEGFGLLSQKAEGAPITYDTMRMAFTTRYTPVVYASGFMVTREAYEDNLYKSQIDFKARMLAKALSQTRETILNNILNRAFNTSYTGGDGKALIVSDHPYVSGSTGSNVLATAANFSEAAVEDMLIQIMNATDARGLKAQISPTKLIVPVALNFEVQRVLKSTGRVGTANNDMNVLKAMSPFSDIVVNRYLTSSTAWFVMTDEPEGLKYVERRADEFGSDNDWETENAKYKVTARFTGGWSNWRCIYGTPGV